MNQSLHPSALRPHFSRRPPRNIASLSGPLGGRIRENRVCLCSFLIPVAVMLGIFIINGVYPFGDESFMHSDMYHQESMAI